MTRTRVTLVCVTAALIVAGAWGSRAYAAGPTVRIVNKSETVTDEQIADALPAFQAAVTEDLAPVWGTDATLTTEPAPNAWTLTLEDDADCFGCAGYHDFKGAPFARVFTTVEPNWQLVVTHELFEMLVDPFVNRGVFAGGRWWLVEVADPPEAERYAYTRPGLSGAPVSISDFVTPAWYGGKRGPYDFTHAIRGALRLKAGGYACWWGGLDWACKSA